MTKQESETNFYLEIYAYIYKEIDVKSGWLTS